MKTSVRFAVAFVALGVLAATAVAAAPVNKAKALMLQKSDFPAGTTVKSASGDASAAGSGWVATFHYKSGQPVELTIAVTVFKSRALAVELFRELKGDMIPLVPKISLPKYGDEQVANHSVLGGSQLIVRKGSVIWMFEPQTFMTRGGKTYELTRAKAIAEYKRYAPKQQRRVGNG